MRILPGLGGFFSAFAPPCAGYGAISPVGSATGLAQRLVPKPNRVQTISCRLSKKKRNDFLWRRRSS